MPNLADLSIALIVLMTAGLIGCAQVPPDRHDRCPSQRLVSLVEKRKIPAEQLFPEPDSAQKILASVAGQAIPR